MCGKQDYYATAGSPESGTDQAVISIRLLKLPYEKRPLILIRLNLKNLCFTAPGEMVCILEY